MTAITEKTKVETVSHKKPYQNLNYSIYLQKFNLKPELQGPWASIGRSNRIQGWKLHLSIIPSEVTQLLDKVVPCLLAHRVPCFKLAKDYRTLSYLNDGNLGHTQVGKFMTIYPASDETALKLVHDLITLTRGMHGPAIVSDLPLGDIVYTRYGGFNPVVQYDRLGLMRRMIYTSDGSLQEDAYQIPFQGPRGIVNPFAQWNYKPSFEDAAPNPVHVVDGKSTPLFGPGYLILETLRRDAKGGVIKALDLRSQATVGLKVLKQGHRFCMLDHFDRDIRHRLKRQAELHRQFTPLAFIPQADPYFEVDGDGYLPLDWIEGQSIEVVAMQTLENSSFNSLSHDKKTLLLHSCQKLVAAVKQLHALGYVHRDLTASNVWLGKNDQLYLLDLELCHAIEDPTPAFGMGTSGFMSPQQAQRNPPRFADDIYAIGCLLILALTSTDPRRIVKLQTASATDLVQKLLGITQLSATTLIDTIVACLAQDPEARPTLDIISSALDKEIATYTPETGVQVTQSSHPRHPPVSSAPTLGDANLKESLHRGIRGLLQQDGATQTEAGIWLSSTIQGSQHQANQHSQTYELRVSANRGVAGVVYGLSRFARFKQLIPEGIAPVKTAIDWLLTKPQTQDAHLPGLHFGTAGVAVALTESIKAKLVTPDEKLDQFIKDCFSRNFDWPDITHGAAGQGVAALYCFDHLGWDFFKTYAQHCAESLVSTQQADGYWIMPSGVPGMSNDILTGFAHGVAGMAYFLIEMAVREKDSKVLESALRALAWLKTQQITQTASGNAVAAWRYSRQNSSLWKWWCHGGPGIALTFIRAYQLTGDSSYAKIARSALRAHPLTLRYPNLTQCHGVSGLGDSYLEAFRAFREEEWLERAQQLARLLIAMAHPTKTGDLYWLAEDPHTATADLMVGSSGILHFLLRLACLDQNIGAPLLLN